MKRIQAVLLSLALLCALLLSGCEGILPSTISASYDLDELPAYSGEPYVTVNGNEPFFVPEDLTTDSYEIYSELDALGRCGGGGPDAYRGTGEHRPGEALRLADRQI